MKTTPSPTNHYRINKKKYACPLCRHQCRRKYLFGVKQMSKRQVDGYLLNYFELLREALSNYLCVGSARKASKKLSENNSNFTPFAMYNSLNDVQPLLSSQAIKDSKHDLRDSDSLMFIKEKENISESSVVVTKYERTASGCSDSTFSRIKRDINNILKEAFNSCKKLPRIQQEHCKIDLRTCISIEISDRMHNYKYKQNMQETKITNFSLPVRPFSTKNSLKLKLNLNLSDQNYQILRNSTESLFKLLKNVRDEFKKHSNKFKEESIVTLGEKGLINGVFYKPKDLFKRHVSVKENLVDIIKCTKIWSEHIEKEDVSKENYRLQYINLKADIMKKTHELIQFERSRLIKNMFPDNNCINRAICCS